jgi:hypothetical protein
MKRSAVRILLARYLPGLSLVTADNAIQMARALSGD